MFSNSSYLPVEFSHSPLDHPMKRSIYLQFSSQFLIFSESGRAELVDLEELETWRAALDLILGYAGVPSLHASPQQSPLPSVAPIGASAGVVAKGELVFPDLPYVPELASQTKPSDSQPAELCLELRSFERDAANGRNDTVRSQSPVVPAQGEQAWPPLKNVGRLFRATFRRKARK